MKVGTDGILLAAWAHAVEPQRILDIGTGTGLIALMLAQRFPEALVDAVELDPAAAGQAAQNAADSPWENRVSVHCVDICRFQSPNRYDLIVANPPFFDRSLKGPDRARNVARHSDALNATQLLSAVNQLLHAAGVFCLIVPAAQGSILQHGANEYQLHCHSICKVSPNADKSVHRWLMLFGRKKDDDVAHTQLVVEASRHDYSEDYRALTREFYLKH